MLFDKSFQHLDILLWVVTISSAVICLIYEVSLHADVVCVCLRYYLVCMCDWDSAIFHTVNE